MHVSFDRPIYPRGDQVKNESNDFRMILNLKRLGDELHDGGLRGQSRQSLTIPKQRLTTVQGQARGGASCRVDRDRDRGGYYMKSYHAVPSFPEERFLALPRSRGHGSLVSSYRCRFTFSNRHNIAISLDTPKLRVTESPRNVILPFQLPYRSSYPPAPGPGHER